MLDDCALKFYEKWNRAWRAQYSNPALAQLSIGCEFLPPRNHRRPLKRLQPAGNVRGKTLFSLSNFSSLL